MGDAIGELTERLTLQRSDPETCVVTSLTRAGSVATAITGKAHGLLSKDYATIAGAAPAGYNGKVKITVLDAVTFTYPVDGSLSSPATQTITVTYASDAQGGRRKAWRSVDTVWAEMIPLKAFEALQLQAIQSDVAYRFRIRVRTDVEPTWRAIWTPRWPPRAITRTLEITGVSPMDDGRTYQLLECSDSPTP